MLPLLFVLWLPSVHSQSAGFAPGVEIGRITKNDLAELSGIASSRNNPGVLWVHNDRNRDKLYAVSTNGQWLATYALGKDVSDLEDIAMGPGPVPELDYIYCGDFGDNSASRQSIRVYRAAEPAIYPYFAASPPSQNFSIVEKVTLIYPDGPHNAEALLVDSITGDVFIATKQIGISRIYRLDRTQFQDGATVTLALAQEVVFNEVSSGDISRDGREILLRQENYALVWPRAVGQTVAEALAGEPREAPVIGMPIEPNGEGVAFQSGGMGYYTVSEGVNPVLYFFARIEDPPTAPQRELVSAGATWKYLDDGSDQGTGWRLPTFADTAWRAGRAQLGYGDDDEQTLLSYGADKSAKWVTIYFRRQFTVADPALFGNLTLRSVFDDGVAVYLNGQEVLRVNLNANATASSAALGSGSALENLWQTYALTNVLQSGTNTLAVELHRHSRSEGDLSFDLQLQADPAEPALRFSAAPQRISATSWALDIHGPSGAVIQVDGATRLNDWNNLGRLVLTNGFSRYIHTAGPGATMTFFRLRR